MEILIWIKKQILFTIGRPQVKKNVVHKELGQVHQLVGLCDPMLPIINKPLAHKLGLFSILDQYNEQHNKASTAIQQLMVKLKGVDKSQPSVSGLWRLAMSLGR